MVLSVYFEGADGYAPRLVAVAQTESSKLSLNQSASGLVAAFQELSVLNSNRRPSSNSTKPCAAIAFRPDSPRSRRIASRTDADPMAMILVPAFNAARMSACIG